jgi:membrane protease YdiL (CAAX protease family)
MRSLSRRKIRPIILSMVAPAAGFTLLLLLEMSLGVEFSKQTKTLTNLVLVALIAFYVFPRLLGIPFGRVETRDFLRGVGFYVPEDPGKHVLLGLVLACCTLSGMMVASILSGGYVLDLSTISFQHLLFSLNPALWEELFFRGVLMVWLLNLGQPLRRAWGIQLALFGVMHVKGFSLLDFVDVFSVMVIAVGFTYAAYKTGSLLTGVVFHYFHDALLYFVQVPGAKLSGVIDNAVFFMCTWLMVGVVCVFTRFFVEKLDVHSGEGAYLQFRTTKNNHS